MNSTVVEFHYVVGLIILLYWKMVIIYNYLGFLLVFLFCLVYKYINIYILFLNYYKH